MPGWSPADNFGVRYTGTFTAPVAGIYEFAGYHDDGMKATLNGQVVYDQNTASSVAWQPARAITLAAGQSVPITVDYSEIGGNARVALFVQAKNTDGSGTVVYTERVVPTSTLSAAGPEPLPVGWTMSADLDGTAGYFKAEQTETAVVLTDADGAKHTWTKTSTGGYTPPTGEEGVLALSPAGGLSLADDDGTTYVFNVDGTLGSSSSALDDRKPAALSYVYSRTGTGANRLTSIVDPASGTSTATRRRVELVYGGQAGCYLNGAGTAIPPPANADPAAPTGMVCQLNYWDGTRTLLWYSGGQLGRIDDPGGEVTAFGYQAQRLVWVRDPLASDWLAANPTADPDLTVTRIPPCQAVVRHPGAPRVHRGGW